MNSRIASVNGIHLHYLDHEGGGTPIVLLPGLSANAHEFDGLAAAGLAPAHRVIAIDLRGRGESEAPASGYRMADHAADVLALLDHLGLARVVMAGHSFGSLLALHLAAHHPRRVERLVMIDGAIEMHPDVRRLIQPSLDRLARVLPSEEAYLAAMRAAPHLVGAWDEWIEGYYRAELEAVPGGGVRSRTKAHAIAQALDGAFAEPWAALCGEVRCPSLLLNALGAYGPPGTPPVVPREPALATAALLARSRYVEVPGNHITMLFGAHAPGIVREIESFLASSDDVAGRTVVAVHRGEAGERRYELFLPSGEATAPRPMVVMLHGCTQDAADLARGTRMSEVAARLGWIALWPEQPKSEHAMGCWNWFLPEHQARDAGEPAILASLVREIAATYGVDASRIHLAGISAGAAMATLLAVAYPELFDALALHSGIPWRAAGSVAEALTVMASGESDAAALGAGAHAAMGPRTRMIPTLVLQGAVDAVVNPRNGERTAEMWATANRLALGIAADAVHIAEEPPRDADGRRCRIWRWRDASGRTLVERWEIAELGHAWSGGDPAGSHVDPLGPRASEVIARFFEQTSHEGDTPAAGTSARADTARPSR